MATGTNSTPRQEPEVLAAEVRAMLGPFFRGSIGPAPEVVTPRPTMPAPPAAAMLELA